jgi:hypothetical protein
MHIHRVAAERAQEETGSTNRQRLTGTLERDPARRGLRHQHRDIGKHVDGRAIVSPMFLRPSNRPAGLPDGRGERAAATSSDLAPRRGYNITALCDPPSHPSIAIGADPATAVNAVLQ